MGVLLPAMAMQEAAPSSSYAARGLVQPQNGGSEVDCVFSVTDRPTRPGSDGPCPAGRVRPTDPVLTGRAQRGEKFWGRTRPTDRPSWD